MSRRWSARVEIRQHEEPQGEVLVPGIKAPNLNKAVTIALKKAIGTHSGGMAGAKAAGITAEILSIVPDKEAVPPKGAALPAVVIEDGEDDEMETLPWWPFSRRKDPLALVHQPEAKEEVKETRSYVVKPFVCPIETLCTKVVTITKPDKAFGL